MLVDDKNKEYFTLKEIQTMQNNSTKTAFISTTQIKTKGKLSPIKTIRKYKNFQKIWEKSINLFTKEEILKYFKTPNFFKKNNLNKYFPKYNLLKLVKNAITFGGLAIKIYKNPIIFCLASLIILKFKKILTISQIQINIVYLKH